MKIYIAGPMRGIPLGNFPAFDEASARWQEAGHTVASPASIDRAFGCDGQSQLLTDPTFIRRAITIDTVVILHSDAIALLPGWETSRGSAVELSLAQFLDLPIYDAITMQRIYPPKTPWRSIPKHYRQPGPPISGQ